MNAEATAALQFPQEKRQQGQEWAKEPDSNPSCHPLEFRKETEGKSKHGSVY